MKEQVLIIVLCFFGFFSFAQKPVSWSSAEMYLALQKLKVLGSVLYVAAHPDDENTRLLSYLSKDKLYRTGYLSITRGDGGQNLVGDEQGIELGLIRTQELLAARRVDGAEQFFTRAFDFGFSKNPEETFTKWNKEKILSDVVWVIRTFQPDVVITRFPTTGEGGHGHHTASAILANEAFTAAADPSRFPEQLKYVKTWQIRRVLWNTFNFGNTNTIRDNQFKIDVGGYNPLLGKSYGEISAESRSQHKSQGFGVPASRGEALEYFAATNGIQPIHDLMEDVQTTWNRVAGSGKISDLINNLTTTFDFLHPENSVKDLVKLYKLLNSLPNSYWRNQKLKETQQLIEQCSGLWMDVFANEQFAVQTDSIRMNFSFNNRNGVDASLKRIVIDEFDSLMSNKLQKNRNLNFAKTFYVPLAKPVTQPYWLQNKMEEGYYNVSDQKLLGQANIQPAYSARLYIDVEGLGLEFTREIKYRFTDPVKGELYQPVSVIPPVTFHDFNPLLVKTEINRNIEFSLVANHQVNVPVPDYTNLNVNSKTDTLSLLIGGFGLKKNQFYNKDFSDSTLSENIYRINLAPYNQTSGYILKTINYNYIPSITYFKEAILNVKKIDVKIAGKRIGYIVGAGDKVPEALEQMGYEVTLLTDKELSRFNLKQFDAIITGIRAYNTNSWLANFYDKLMRYINEGGNLIVQYNTSNFISNIKSKVGPYDFNISRTRVTNEDAPVTFLKPNHPVMNFPNKITRDDFNNWIQERSIYHATELDKNFETIFSLNDPGEKPDEGSLIIANYGKGTFVYTGLVFFRELPAGVPGAYRLLANLIALNKQKAF